MPPSGRGRPSKRQQVTKIASTAPPKSPPSARFPRPYMSGGHLPPAPLDLYTEIPQSQVADITERRESLSRDRQVIDQSAFPAKSVGLRKAQMSQHAIGKFAGHFI